MPAYHDHLLQPHSMPDSAELDQAIAIACQRIAPSWPLDRMIAVSPYWHQIDRPFSQIAKEQADLAGSPMSLPLHFYRQRWQAQQIQRQHLQQALQEQSSELTAEQALQALTQQEVAPVAAPLLVDMYDQAREQQHQPPWQEAITHQIGQYCAAYFDRDLSDWRAGQQQPLYQGWRDTLRHDHSIALLMHTPHLTSSVQTLATEPRQQILQGLTQLHIAPGQWSRFLEVLLLRISGWASRCAYLAWQAARDGTQDDTLLQLLAIRLSWECLVDDGIRLSGSAWQQWNTRWQQHFQQQHPHLEVRQLWQRAHEISYQQQLYAKLRSAERAARPCNGHATDKRMHLQAVFCIDVRSEVFRRHLEAQSTTIQTLGFAGFFGLPIAYTPLGTQATRPQLPGLLAPSWEITDSCGVPGRDLELRQKRQHALQKIFSWQPFNQLPASAFTLVETLGLSYLATLIRRTLADYRPLPATPSPGLNQQQAASLSPRLAGSLAQRVELASTLLQSMNLSKGLAPWVLLVGHGSQTRNNPQHAALECGACCGQNGSVNARALAALLNDPTVRSGLAEQAIHIPPDTRFIAALHNTTTDEVSLYDTQQLDLTNDPSLRKIQDQLNQAGAATRQERAAGLGLAALATEPARLHRALRQRANDWAQTRPEWGLANNAAFLIAPRWLSRQLDLEGRCFLHEYDHTRDTDGTGLEQIMTAPMLVTHWINMQYFASTVDNHRYGSGNKTLHNVVGGRIGLFEGNGGDLRTGLALQSVHDGQDWRHDPLRLTVVIAASQAAIERVLKHHPEVQALVDNQWLYLVHWQSGTLARYTQGQWRTTTYAEDGGSR